MVYTTYAIEQVNNGCYAVHHVTLHMMLTSTQYINIALQTLQANIITLPMLMSWDVY